MSLKLTQINEISSLFGSLITKKELLEQIDKAANILFQRCLMAELVFSVRNQRSLNCPMEVLLRGFCNSSNEDVAISEISSDFIRRLFRSTSQPTPFDLHTLRNNMTYHLISLQLNLSDNVKQQVAQFFMILSILPKDAKQRVEFFRNQLLTTLTRINRLEQLNLTSVASPLLQRREPCCSQGANASIWIEQNHVPKIMKLCETLWERDTCRLQQKVLAYLIERINARLGFLIMQELDTSEWICYCTNLVIFEEPIYFENENLFNQVIESKKFLICSEPNSSQVEVIKSILLTSVAGSSNYNPENEVNHLVESLLYFPIVCQITNQPVAIACFINKQNKKEFTGTDVQILQECFRYTTPILLSSLAYENEKLHKIRTQEMLHVARNIFSHMTDLTNLLLKIMQEARNLTKAERCSVFLLDKETKMLVSKVLDGLPTAPNKNTTFVTTDGTTVQLPEEIRLNLNQGIAGHVATTGELLNIRDAYSHPLFYRGVDEATGFRTRNILCFPIKNEEDGIVGVAQLCNKTNHPYFTKADEEVAKAFAIYCCISIVQSIMYNHVQDAQHRTKLANELMMYHMKVPDTKVKWLTNCGITKMNTFLPNYDKFNSIPRSISDEDKTILFTLSMFEDLGLIKRWRMLRKTLARFILMVRRGYRDPPYHNWWHAFTVAHFVYICIKRLLQDNQLTDLELLALFVAALCHDIDHRGTNNSFQVESKSLLAALYSSEGSVLERHHFSQTICILNTDECNVFERLSKEEYSEILDLIRDIILATDLVHHIRIMPELESLSTRGYNTNKPEDHHLLLCLLMTSADLSDQTKEWRNTVAVAKLIYEEFFKQGDLERALGHSPSDNMDRERACVPDLQISFLDYIIIPLYKVLVNLFPQCSEILANIYDNRKKWKVILDQVHDGKLKGNGSEIFEYSLFEIDRLAVCDH